MTGEFVTEQLKVVDALAKLGSAQGVKLFVVGGVVRDMMRGSISHDRDLDVVVEGDAIAFANSALPELGGTLKKFPDFFTAKVLTPTLAPLLGEVDFASTRIERYQAPGALPTVKLAGISDDLRRRDFSVNAMALPLQSFGELLSGAKPLSAITETILDPFGGAEDLAKREIRVLHDRSFLDDPTRLFRACRYALRLDAKLSQQTEELFKAAIKGNATSTISRFRIATEIRKICSESKFGAVFALAESYGLLAGNRLISEERRKELLDRVLKLQTILPEGSDAAYPALILILVMLHPAGSAIESYLSDFGFSKKKIQSILSEAEMALKAQDTAALSEPALAARRSGAKS